MSPRKVVIVGGGISGLATAYFLGKRGIDSVLFEKENRLGGLIRTDRVLGCDLEAGPDSFIATKPSVLELARELGIENQVIDSNDAKRRIFIGRPGRLVPMPDGMVMMAPADLDAVRRSSFFSEDTKRSFADELCRPPRDRAEDVSLGEFTLDHFGPEVLDTIAEPLLTGVYGGDPSGLSLRSVLPRFLDYERQYGSVIRGVQEERRARKPGTSLFRSFKHGMETLTVALSEAIRETTEVLHEEVLSVVPGRAVISANRTVPADQVVVAVPAHHAASILGWRQLGGIPYSSAILVTYVLDRGTLGHALDGFGFLIPRSERKTVAAATWISTKFPNRTPPPLVAIRTFIVGDEAVRLLEAPDRELVDAAWSDLQRWMNLKNEPKFSGVARWPLSMPQYVVAHEERVQQIRSQVAATPGIYLVGNAYEGVGIPDCVRIAKSVAEKIADRSATKY